jgi:hypothetical protein
VARAKGDECFTRQLAVGGLPEYLEFARTRILPGLAEYGLQPVGFWYTAIGPLNEVVHLWAYADLNERKEKWGTWECDPRRAEFMAKLRGVVISQSNKILSPTDFSAMK